MLSSPVLGAHTLHTATNRFQILQNSKNKYLINWIPPHSIANIGTPEFWIDQIFHLFPNQTLCNKSGLFCTKLETLLNFKTRATLTLKANTRCFRRNSSFRTEDG